MWTVALVTLTTCYANVFLAGTMNDVEKAVKSVGPVYTVHSRIYSARGESDVLLNFLVSVTAINESSARSQTDSAFVQSIFKGSGGSYIEARAQFVGCKQDMLQ